MKINIIDVNKYVLNRNIFHNRLLHLNMIGMKILGFMIFDNQIIFRLHCFRGVLFCAIFIIFNISQIVDLFTMWGNVDEMTTNAATTLLFVTTSYRILNFYLNRSIYVNIVIEVDDGIKLIEKYGNKNEKLILNNNIKYTKWLTIIFCACALITANLMCINSFIQSLYYDPNLFMFNSKNGNNETMFPPTILRSWVPFDNIWQYFYIIYLIQFSVMWIGMIIVPCWHTFIVTLMIYAINKLDILAYKLENIEDFAIVFHEKYKEKARYNILANCVEEQIDIIGFVHRLENLISGSLFLDFIVYSVLICALLFQASEAEIGVKLAINICYIITMIAILWMYYWHANEITLKSANLPSAVYKCNWYNYSINFRKAMLLFMYGSNRPLRMKAGFIIMTLNTFLNILRASYSYFTLLTQINN